MIKELKNRILENKVLTHDERMEIIKVLEQETVSKEIYENEHFARKQAEYELWKIKEQQPSEGCVSREAMLNAITEIDNNVNMDIYTNEVREIVNELPPVIPTHGTCKDCEHWKDSDGVYRRGVDAESKCPINIKEVCEGKFFCKDFEKRGKEEV